MGLGALALDDRMPPGGTLELSCDLLTNFECANPNVRADRRDELAGGVLHGHDGPAYDARHRPAPSCMHCGNVSARRMRDQDRNAVRSARSHGNPFVARDERVAFPIRELFGSVRARHLPHLVSMHLPLLE